MDPKEKKVKEEELNVEETQNHAEEQPQNEQAEDATPLTHEEELEKELEKAKRRLKSRRINICACLPSSTTTVNAP